MKNFIKAAIKKFFKKENLLGKIIKFEDGSYRFCEVYWTGSAQKLLRDHYLYYDKSRPFSKAYDTLEDAKMARDKYIENVNAEKKSKIISMVCD